MTLNKDYLAQAPPEEIRGLKQDQLMVDFVNKLYESYEWHYTFNREEVAKMLQVTVAKVKFWRREGMIHTAQPWNHNSFTRASIAQFLAYHGMDLIKKHNKKGGNR